MRGRWTFACARFSVLSVLWVLESDGFDVDGDSAMVDDGGLMLMQGQ